MFFGDFVSKLFETLSRFDYSLYEIVAEINILLRRFDLIGL